MTLVYKTTHGTDFLPLAACALFVVLTESGRTEYLLLSVIGAMVGRENGVVSPCVGERTNQEERSADACALRLRRHNGQAHLLRNVERRRDQRVRLDHDRRVYWCAAIRFPSSVECSEAAKY